MAGKRQRRIRRTMSASTMGSELNMLEISPKHPKEKQKPANPPLNPTRNRGSDLPPAVAAAIPVKRMQGVKDEAPPPPPPLLPEKGSAIFVNECSSWDAYEELVSMALPAMNFLEACSFCKRTLGDGLDIYMYRGDQAFCSEECRHEQILVDENKDKCSLLALRIKICASPVRSADQQTPSTAAAR